MSRIRTDSIATRDGSKDIPVATVVHGSAKAWVNFDGTQTAGDMIRASFNVSSITDAGVGNYRVHFTTPMPNANFCTNITVPFIPTSESTNVGGYAADAGRVTIGCRAGTPSTSLYDPNAVQVAIFS